MESCRDHHGGRVAGLGDSCRQRERDLYQAVATSVDGAERRSHCQKSFVDRCKTCWVAQSLVASPLNANRAAGRRVVLQESLQHTGTACRRSGSTVFSRVCLRSRECRTCQTIAYATVAAALVRSTPWVLRTRRTEGGELAVRAAERVERPFRTQDHGVPAAWQGGQSWNKQTARNGGVRPSHLAAWKSTAGPAPPARAAPPSADTGNEATARDSWLPMVKLSDVQRLPSCRPLRASRTSAAAHGEGCVVLGCGAGWRTTRLEKTAPREWVWVRPPASALTRCGRAPNPPSAPHLLCVCDPVLDARSCHGGDRAPPDTQRWSMYMHVRGLLLARPGRSLRLEAAAVDNPVQQLFQGWLPECRQRQRGSCQP
jgi:hypothetical protein